MTTQYSTVKWFDAKKGYGFINHPEGGNDVFIHYSQIDSDDDFKTLRTGQSVQFEMNDGPKGLHAVNVRALEEDDTSTSQPSPSSELDTETSDIEPVQPEEHLEAQPSLDAPTEKNAPDEGTSPTL
ncbi:cold-shock protein [Longibacter salinarum]|uniref:Cold-shock protein n=1 Tax=Longibacter salinarum TaxID=1850348 RepID=A0A2A8D0H4_9BACT|nr:cold-shock protein [Longibacter salinarum]